MSDDEKKQWKVSLEKAFQRQSGAVGEVSFPLPDRIFEIIESIPAREVEILRLHYGVGSNKTCTLREIAKQVKLSRSRVYNLEINALRKIAHRLRIL